MSKSILKKIFVDVATYLFGLKLHNVELIETEQQRIVECRADLVVRVQDETIKKYHTSRNTKPKPDPKAH